MATAPTNTKPVIPTAKFDAEGVKAGAIVKAMTAAAATGAKGAPFEVPIDAIRVMDDFNVRVTGTPAAEESMAELVQSIRNNGFMAHKPLALFVATDGDANVLYVKDGHRRFEAVARFNASLAEGETAITSLPAVASAAGSLEDMMIEVAQSNTGAPLTMYEKGLLAQRLLNANMTKEDIADRLSMTPRHLNNVLLLASAPAKLRDLIVTDKVTSTTGLKLMKDPKTAAAKAADMVKASEAKGKAKATPKDSTVKMQRAGLDIDFAAGQSIKEHLQTIAAKVRELVGHNASDDAITTALGKITLTIATPAPVTEKAPPKAPAAKKAPAEKKAPAAKKTPEQAKAAAKAHLGDGGKTGAPAAGDKAPAPAEDLAGL